MTRPQRIVWLESAYTLDLLYLLPGAVFGDAGIRYDENRASLWALRWARLLRAAGLAARLRPAQLTLAALDERGRALNYRKESLLADAVRACCERHYAERPRWFQDMTGSFLSAQLFYRATFITMVEHAAAATGAERHDHLTRHPANAFLAAVYSRPGFRLRQSLTVHHHARRLLAPLRPLITAAIATVLPRCERSTGLRGLPAVWIEYYPGDVDSFISRAFWRDGVDRERFDLTFYFDRSDTPWSEEALRRTRAAGFSAVEMLAPAAQSGLSTSDILELLRAAWRRGGPTPLWLRLFELQYETLVSCWTAIFARHNVKLLVQHQEKSWKAQAQATALEKAGGIMLGVHWSLTPFDEQSFDLTPQHVYFVWGEESRRWLLAKGHSSRHVLPCGVWIGPTPRWPLERAKLKSGLDFMLAVFDSSYGYSIHHSGEQMSLFLDRMIALLEVHTTWGAVMKPKSEQSWALLPGGPRLLERIASLEKEGRVLVAQRETSPITAAEACDLAVCYSVNSAGIIIGAHGGRAVHWDCSGWLDHPFYADRDQKFFYPSLVDMLAAVEAAADGDRSVGDFSRWCGKIDAFNDGRAAERVGGFIASYLDCTSSGTPALQALDEAAAEYRVRHGLDSAGQKLQSGERP